MAKRRSTSKPGIRARCEEIIDITVVDHFRGYEAFAAMRARPDYPTIGPVMAEVFVESIQRGCRALGAVTGDELPDVDRFLPDERTGVGLARQVMPSMTAQTMIGARRVHRDNARTAKELIEAYAEHGAEQVRALYQQAAANNEGENLLVMLWGTAITVQRQARAAKPGGTHS